jgi:putative DNA primase/helicase
VSEKVSASELAEELAAKLTIFRSSGEAYALINGTAVLIKSGGFSRALAHQAWRNGKLTLSPYARDQVVDLLVGIALYERDEKPVHLRVAHHDDAIWIDLGADGAGFVEVTSAGWQVHERAPVMFRRPKNQLPLPTPVSGGSLAELRDFVPVEDDANFRLLLGWLVMTYFVGKPCPLLLFVGEQGTAKSTTTRIGRALTDPNTSALRALPKTVDDLIVGAQHSHVVCFDNLSSIPPELLDALCRLVTGGGLSKRTLYSDAEETVVDVKRPIVANGIPDLAERGDIAERSLSIPLRRIPESKRRDETEFWSKFNEAAPRILGALFDALSATLSNLPDTKLAKLPRMADFARVIEAAGPALGAKPGEMSSAYAANRNSVTDSLEDDPFVALLDEVIKSSKGQLRGTPTQVFAKLSWAHSGKLVGTVPYFPKTAPALGQKLRRMAPQLRSLGFVVELEGFAGRDSGKARDWLLAFPGDDGVDAWTAA